MTENTYKPDPEKIAEAASRSKTRAEDYINNPEKSRRLLDEALKKAKKQEKPTGHLAGFWEGLRAFFRLLQAYFNKQYTEIAWGSIAAIVGAVIYFVSPIDLMPDWIPLAGFVDDGAVLMFVVGQIHSDLEKFLRWEAEKEPVNFSKPDMQQEIIEVELNQKDE